MMLRVSAAPAAAACRVWIRSQPCLFATSVFDTVTKNFITDHHCHHYDRVLVSLKEQDGNLCLATAINNTHDRNSIALPMGRARDCPPLGSTSCPTTVVLDTMKSAKKKPFVGLAVVGMVLDSTGQYLLITRRPSYMRSFPGAWVFPGGGADPQESLSQAVSREISEETGLSVVENHWTLQSVWESVYPTKPGVGIQAHHLVVYLSAQLSSSSSQELNLCQEEVDGAVWLSRENVQEILTATRRQEQQKDVVSNPSLLTMHTTTKGQTVEISLHDLVGIYPQSQGEELCGLSQGSLFALEEFLLSTGDGRTAEEI
jgi:8-oxo-dGTP pyrophosphatase MutT (NUDIX family)